MARAADAGDSRLSALITRAEAGGWDPDRAIDWSRRPRRPPLIPPRLYRILVSQLYHGERATLAMCERLMRELPDAGARRFVATQAADETRHAQVYARYLDGIGGMAPTDDAVQRTFDAALAWDGPWQGLVGPPTWCSNPRRCGSCSTRTPCSPVRCFAGSTPAWCATRPATSRSAGSI